MNSTTTMGSTSVDTHAVEQAPEPPGTEPSVPLIAAQLARCAGWGPETVPTVTVGGRVEVDTAHLDEKDAQQLSSYWDRCRTFWQHRQQTGHWIGVRRVLHASCQTDSKAAGRADLVAELDALDRLPLLKPIVDTLCGSEIDIDALHTIAADHSGTVTQRDGEVTVTVRLDPASSCWETAVGGPPSMAEVVREVTLSARHAAWRDRRVRRLTKIHVVAEEVWPDPAS